mmetsp:Transcript_1350/g.1479  ORF Transcript_1350/g.1479 Transcript_1350/m.1479 type:complete len:89 (-) Transcript_1350:158-424(-)
MTTSPISLCKQGVSYEYAVLPVGLCFCCSNTLRVRSKKRQWSLELLNFPETGSVKILIQLLRHPNRKLAKPKSKSFFKRKSRTDNQIP